jgi:hypothetical protein
LFLSNGICPFASPLCLSASPLSIRKLSYAKQSDREERAKYIRALYNGDKLPVHHFRIGKKQSPNISLSGLCFLKEGAFNPDNCDLHKPDNLSETTVKNETSAKRKSPSLFC